MTDLNTQIFYTFLRDYNKNLYEKMKNKELNLDILLENFNLIKNNSLTLAGNLIF
jgi:hypothetical protein